MANSLAYLSVIAFIIVSIAVSGLVGAYFWIPAWYGWVSLVIGIVLTLLVAIFAYHGYLFVTLQGPYAK